MSSTSNNSLVGGAIVKFDYDRPPQTKFYKVTTENQEKYIEKMKKVKIADYDNTAFLSNCLEFNKASNSTYMNKRLTAALALQSKLPVYCLAGCGAGQNLYGTPNVEISLSITDKNGGEILDEEKLPKQVVPRTLDWMMNQEPNAKLEHIIFVSENTEKQSGYEDNTFGDDIVEVAYIFKDEKTKHYSILRNKIGGKKYNGYYKLFTVCRHTIVRFQAANGKIQKTVVSPKYYENELFSSLDEDDRYKENVLKEPNQKIFAPVKFKIGDQKKEYLSMLFYVKDNCNLTVQSLQSKILAVHTLMPTEEQIKADSRPFWVAKRLKYEDYFVTTEDVTLRNGKSYYWDIGECWVARRNGNPSKDKLNEYTAKYNSWYWDNGPFLPGNEETNKKGNWDKKHYLAYINKSNSFRNEEMPPNDLGIEYCGDTSDVTRHSTNIQTVNIQPYQIATKAYAVIIKSKEFQEAEGGDLQNGGYYINGMLSEKGGYAGFINAADKGAYGKDCFINGRGDMPPNNGVLYSPKDELFTAYFLVKGSVSENLVKKQYEILNTLKNGSREDSSAPQGESPEHKKIREEKEKEVKEGTLQGKDYYPNYYKKFIDKNNDVIKKLNDAAEDLKEAYKDRVKEINNAIDAFENGRPATSEIGALECLGDLIGGSIQSEKLGESNKELFKTVNDKKIKLDTDKILYKCPDGNIISKISDKELTENLKVIDDMKNPFKNINFINHFSYTEKPIAFHDKNDWLCEGQYVLTYGWNQTRVAELDPTSYFREIFQEINYDQYEHKDLLKDSIHDYPWWREVEGSNHIIFNECFVKTFFTEYDGNEDSADSYIFNKKITLKPIEFKIEDRDSKTRTVTITEKKIKEIEEYFNKSNPANESFDNGEFAKKYIDEKTEFIVDCFYNMIKRVYGAIDSEGVPRTKSYFVKGTPFELRTIKDESGNPIKMVGFDLRELIDACFEQLFAADEEAVRNCVTKIGNVLGKRNWDISNEYESFFKDLQPLFQNALDETATRLNGEFDLETAKRQAQMMKISQEAGIIFQRKFNTGVKISIGMALAGAVTAKVAKVIVKKAIENAMNAAAKEATKEAAKWAAKQAVKKALSTALASFVGTCVASIASGLIIAATIAEIVWFLYCYLRDSYLQAHLAYSDDYVYKFTCKAKRSERLYSMTKRGCIISDVIAEVGQPKLEGETEKTKGDYERVKSYYNWLADPEEETVPIKSSLLEFNKEIFGYDLDGNANSISLRDKYDGRVAVIIPSTEDALSDEDVYSDYSESALENIENFIQTWMAKKEVAVESQAELPIEGYYDMLNGMHPYVEVGFRMGLGLCGRKKIDGNADVFYNEAGLPIIVKRGNNYYKVKHNLVSYKDKNGNSVEGYDAGRTYNFSEGSSDLQVISKAEYIKLASRNFRRINSRDYPYFESMTIKDNGVKKVTLKLIDPNFASYTTGIRSYYCAGGKAAKNENGDFVRLDIYDEDDYENKVFSLEQLIRGALRSPTFIKEERIERYSNETGNLKNDFLSIDESLVASPTNLKIRYGYDDFNPSGERFSDSRFVDVAKRDARWWNVRHLGNTNFNTVTHVKKYISDGDIENRGGRWISVKEAKMTEGDGIKPSEDTTTNVENSRGYDVDHYVLLKSNAQTVVMSKEIDFMITNFKSKLTNLGIEYTIEGIETKDANIIRTRFLQRYASINANPEEVLYILMHMFNEDNNGNNIKESRVKILLVSDDEDTQVPLMKDKLNMEFDLKKLKEEEYDATMADNIYEMAYQQEMLMVKEDLLKKINITLGGAAAVKNYGNGNAVNSYTPLYKTLAQLLNEFCSACPPKKKIEKRELVTDENGNDILSNQASTISRPLKWFSFEDTAHDTTYVCLYYRTVIKPPKIRVYTYGPMNPTISCVTDLTLENANEFAVLSAVRSFDGKKSKLTTRSSNIYAEREEQTNKEEQADKFKLGATWGGTDYVGLNAENYSQAFASCMYNGNMTILGDPFWSFDGLIQPCTYPIKLNVIMPQSEFTRQVDGGKGTVDLRKQIEELRAQSNNREVEENYWYGETHERSLKKNIYKNSDPEHENIVCVKPADTVRVHQVLHESSGYYVVKDITQTINQGGFTTTLGIMSYPNIHKDVLLTPDEAKARSSAKS